MASGGYDYLIKLGIEMNDVDKAIADIDTAFNKQYKLKVDTGDLTKITQSLSNVSRMIDNINSANASAARQASSRTQSLVNSLYTSTSRAKNNAKYNVFEAQTQKTEAYLEKLEEYKRLMKELETNASDFKAKYENSNSLTRNSKEYIDALTRQYEISEKLSKVQKELSSDKYNISNKSGILKATDDSLKSISNITEAEDKIKSLIQTMHGADSAITFGNISSDLKSISYSVTDADGTVSNFRSSLDTLNGGLRETAINSVSASSGIEKTVSGLKTSVAGYLSSILTLRTAIRVLKEGIGVVKEFDSAMTSISMTMDTTPAQLSSLGDAVINAAKDMGTSVSQALDVSKIYANMQTTPEEIIRLATPTIELANAAELDTSTVSGYIQSVINQFEMSSDDAEHIADVYENISANIKLDFAEGIKDIAEGVEVAGTIVNESGMSFEKFAAIVAKTAETTRQGGSQIGNQWKTILTRISKASGVSDEEIDPATLSDASESLHKIGIEVYNAKGEFNDVDNILTELSQKWGDLSDAQQAEISFNLAATRNRNTLTVALKNYAEATALANAAEQDEGTAAKNQEIWMESYTAKLNQAGVEIDKLYHSLLDSDLTKGLIDGFTDVLNLINNFLDATGSIGTAITALIGTAGLLKLGDIFELKHIQAFSKALSGLS